MMKWIEVIKISTSKLETNWQELMKTLDSLFQLRTRESENNLAKRKNLKELISNLKWIKWDKRRMLDTQLLKINMSNSEFLPAKLLLNIDMKSLPLPQPNCSTSLPSLDTNKPSSTKKMFMFNINLLRSTSPNWLNKKMLFNKSWKMLQITS